MDIIERMLRIDTGGSFCSMIQDDFTEAGLK
jgi:hypothetical protein